MSNTMIKTIILSTLGVILGVAVKAEAMNCYTVTSSCSFCIYSVSCNETGSMVCMGYSCTSDTWANCGPCSVQNDMTGVSGDNNPSGGATWGSGRRTGQPGEQD